MENLPRKVEKDLVKVGQRPKKVKRKENWTLLLINDSGKTIHIKKVQVLSRLMIFLVLFLIISGAGVYSYFKFDNLTSIAGITKDSKNQEDNIPLDQGIDNLSLINQKENPKSNTREKDSNYQKKEPLKTQPQFKKETKKESSKSGEKKDEKSPVISEKANKSETVNTQQETVSAEPVQGVPVAVEDFKCSYKSSRNVLGVKFNIKNNSLDSDSVSGHAVVVLRRNKTDIKKCLALPDVELVSGKPTGKETGQTFSISFYKTLHFKAKGQKDPGYYKIVSIYIFTDEGELLLEENHDIVIK